MSITTFISKISITIHCWDKPFIQNRLMKIPLLFQNTSVDIIINTSLVVKALTDRESKKSVSFGFQVFGDFIFI